MKAKSPTNAGKNVTDTCPTCGCMVEVVGDVTKHYKPLPLQVTHQDTLQDMKEGKHNHILAPGFEHLPYDAGESGIATDHTTVSEEKQCMYCEETVKYLSGVFTCKNCSGNDITQPAVSDEKLLDLLLSEDGLEDERISKLFKESINDEYTEMLKQLHEAWGKIKQLQIQLPAVSEEEITALVKDKYRTYINSIVQDSLIADILQSLNVQGEAVKCLYESDDTTGMNCKHCGDPKWVHEISGLPPTPEEKGGEG